MNELLFFMYELTFTLTKQPQVLETWTVPEVTLHDFKLWWTYSQILLGPMGVRDCPTGSSLKLEVLQLNFHVNTMLIKGYVIQMCWIEAYTSIITTQQ